MRRSARTRSPYPAWLAAIIALLLVALAVLAWGLWPRDDSSTPDPGATVTLSAAVPTSSTSSTGSTSTTSTAPPQTTTTTQPAPVPPLDFDANLAMSHIQVLAGSIGPRKSGSDAEDAAFAYASDYLSSLDYGVAMTEVPLPDGDVSHNLMVTKTGTSNAVMVVGAHVDSHASAPGGNDNASGVAVVLELARDLRHADTVPTIVFVIFGAEEMTDSNADHHHYGSRQFVQTLTEQDRSALVGMISVDMVGYGSQFKVRTMGKGSRLLSDMVRTYSSDHVLATRYLRDTGAYGWSDHEPFELAGFPAVWVEWREDPKYHTSGDTYEHCDVSDVLQAGQALVGFLGTLTQADLDALAAARELD